MTDLQLLQAQVNLVNCGATDTGGTGTAGCRFDWSRIKTVELTPRSFKYTKQQTLAYIREQQQLGNIIIINNVVSYVDASADPNIITREGSGLKEIAGENPYEYNMTTDNGLDFYKKLRTYNSSGQYNIALYDVEGNKIFTETKSGEFKGFSLGMFFTGKYKGKDGSNPSSYATMIQYQDYKEMDRAAWIASDELDYSTTEIDGWNDTKIVIDAVAVGDTTLTFTHKLADKTHNVEGTLLTNYLFKKDGVPFTPTGTLDATTTPGKLIATIPAAVDGEVYTVQTNDSTLTTSAGREIATIVSPLGVLYKSNNATVTAAAVPVNPLAPVITSSHFLTGTIGTPLTYSIVATNTPTSYAIAGVPSGGLSFNSTTGVLSGTPTGSANTRVVRLDAINANGTGSIYLEINIS